MTNLRKSFEVSGSASADTPSAAAYAPQHHAVSNHLVAGEKPDEKQSVVDTAVLIVESSLRSTTLPVPVVADDGELFFVAAQPAEKVALVPCASESSLPPKSIRSNIPGRLHHVHNSQLFFYDDESKTTTCVRISFHSDSSVYRLVALHSYHTLWIGLRGGVWCQSDGTSFKEMLSDIIFSSNNNFAIGISDRGKIVDRAGWIDITFSKLDLITGRREDTKGWTIDGYETLQCVLSSRHLLLTKNMEYHYMAANRIYLDEKEGLWAVVSRLQSKGRAFCHFPLLLPQDIASTAAQVRRNSFVYDVSPDGNYCAITCVKTTKAPDIRHMLHLFVVDLSFTRALQAITVFGADLDDVPAGYVLFGGVVAHVVWGPQGRLFFSNCNAVYEVQFDACIPSPQPILIEPRNESPIRRIFFPDTSKDTLAIDYETHIKRISRYPSQRLNTALHSLHSSLAVSDVLSIVANQHDSWGESIALLPEQAQLAQVREHRIDAMMALQDACSNLSKTVESLNAEAVKGGLVSRFFRLLDSVLLDRVKKQLEIAFHLAQCPPSTLFTQCIQGLLKKHKIKEEDCDDVLRQAFHMLRRLDTLNPEMMLNAGDEKLAVVQQPAVTTRAAAGAAAGAAAAGAGAATAAPAAVAAHCDQWRHSELYCGLFADTLVRHAPKNALATHVVRLRDRLQRTPALINAAMAQGNTQQLLALTLIHRILNNGKYDNFDYVKAEVEALLTNNPEFAVAKNAVLCDLRAIFDELQKIFAAPKENIQQELAAVRSLIAALIHRNNMPDEKLPQVSMMPGQGK